jgi:hypothetical protein
VAGIWQSTLHVAIYSAQLATAQDASLIIFFLSAPPAYGSATGCKITKVIIRQRNRPSPSRVNDSFWFLIAVVLDAHKWSRAAVKPSGAAQLWSAHASTPLRVQLPGPNQPACMPPCQHCLPVGEKTCSRRDSRWASIGRLGVPLDASPPTTSTCRCPLRFTCAPRSHRVPS